MKTLVKLKNLKNKRVLVRVDFNVPIENKKVLEDTRMRAVLPTIHYLIKNKAKIILVAHLGRPDGKVVRSLRLDPIAAHLSTLLGQKVKKLETRDFKFNEKTKNYFKKQIDDMVPGQVIMLDNIRFSPNESKNTGMLSTDLASMADIFVQEGFAVAHRAEASVAGVAKFLPSYAGMLLEKEIKGLEKVIKKSKKPFVLVLGGVKVRTKTPVAENLMPKLDHILLGGAIVNSYLKLKGYKIGKSTVDEEVNGEVEKFCQNKKVILPLDFIVGTKDGGHYSVVDLEKTPHMICKNNEAIFDIGPKTIKLFATYIKKANTILWNGAMGYFEQYPYRTGTLSIARLVASRSQGKAFGVIGGGETLQAMDEVKMSEFVDLVSTGGGAMLEFLSGKKLPGIEVLK